MNWRDAAQQLFGPRWQTKLARVTGLSRRSVSYWAAGEREPPADFQAALCAIAAPLGSDQALAYGTIWLAFLDDSIQAELDHARHVEAMARKFLQDKRQGRLTEFWQADD